MRPRIPAIVLPRPSQAANTGVRRASGTLASLLRRTVGLIACCAALCAADVAAQVRSGQTVRVRLATGQRFVARVVAIDSSPRALRFADAQLVPVSAIDTLWLRRRATGRGALIGGIVVGAASFGFLTIVCRAFSEGECDAWGAVIGLTAVGAGGGALLGAGIGSLIPRWQRVDPQRIAVSFGVGTTGLSVAARIGF